MGDSHQPATTRGDSESDRSLSLRDHYYRSRGRSRVRTVTIRTPRRLQINTNNALYSNSADPRVFSSAPLIGRVSFLYFYSLLLPFRALFGRVVFFSSPPSILERSTTWAAGWFFMRISTTEVSRARSSTWAAGWLLCSLSSPKYLGVVNHLGCRVVFYAHFDHQPGLVL